MSLLTKEQQTIVENIRQAERNAFYNPDPGCGNQFMNARVAAIELLSIIDDLQARAQKQYTESQMRTAFEQQCDEGKSLESFVTPDGKFVSGLSVYAKHGWMACARFLGALKAEP